MPHQRLVREPEQKKPYSILRASIAETTVNVYAERSIQTPVSAAYFQAMRIHKIVFGNDFPDTVEDVQTLLDMQLHTRPQTGLVSENIASPGMIATYRQVRRWFSSAAGGESEFLRSGIGLDRIWDFGEQGLLVTDNNIHLGVKGTGNVNLKGAQVAIYYTLETLQPDEYVAALTVLGADL